MQEVWKDIPEYEGRYQVSDKGRVRSFVYKTNKAEHILKHSITRGYHRVILTDEQGNKKTLMVHRLVIIAFKGLQPRMQVNHIDGNKSNNALSNLEWCSGSENMIHAYRMGLELPCNNGLNKKIEVLKQGERVAVFNSIRDMCRCLNLERRSVQRTLTGKHKSHKGYTFRTI